MMLFTFAGNTGLRFIDQGQGGAQADFINLFVDGAANNLEIWQAKDINMVSPYLYAHYIMPGNPHTAAHEGYVYRDGQPFQRHRRQRRLAHTCVLCRRRHGQHHAV